MAEKLEDADPPLLPSPALNRLLRADLPSSNGSRVGELEDRLQATFCAYVAAYLAIRGPQDCFFLGDLDTGLIVLPTTRQSARAEGEYDDEGEYAEDGDLPEEADASYGQEAYDDYGDEG